MNFHIIKNRSSSGGVLVEFALAIPLLVAILYFTIDIPRYQLMKTRMKNASYYACSMMQNISQVRANKTITKRDLKIISTSSFMNYFNGLRQFIPQGTYYGLTFLLYIKGMPKARQVSYGLWDSNIPTQPLINSTSTSHTSLNVYSSSALNLKTNVNPTDIHKDLVIQEGKIKIILQQVINYNLSGNKVGFYLLNPIGRGYNKYCYFHTVTIFKPKPGLFSETPPQ